MSRAIIIAIASLSAVVAEMPRFLEAIAAFKSRLDNI